jgi:hypothetical protein
MNVFCLPTPGFSICCMQKDFTFRFLSIFHLLSEYKLSNRNKTFEVKDWQFTDNLINLEEK